MAINNMHFPHSFALSCGLILLALLGAPLSASESDKLDTLALTSFNAGSPDFATAADETKVIDIPFTNFFPQFRGFKLDGPELDASQIAEFALYQYDKTDGPFNLHLISVEAYMQSEQP
jgi:hypothetical protein